MSRRRTKSLSFCIPTYNRDKFLEKTVRRIFGQESDVIVNISDNASTDSTHETVTRLRKEFGNRKIKYFRQRKNIGFDKNLIYSVKMATSDYCWIISDDDLPSNGSIAKIFEIINLFPKITLIHVNYSRFDNLLKKVTSSKMEGSINKDMYYDNSNKFFFERITDSYFEFLGTNIVTMSTNIINRREWKKSLEKVKKYTSHNFIHCFVIASMIKERPSIYYVSNPQIQYLANNHRIWPNNIWEDFNHIFMDYLVKIGYEKRLVSQMRKIQKKYEGRESLTKTPVIKEIYQILRPMISTARYVIDQVNNK